MNNKVYSYINGFTVNLRDVEVSDAEFILSLRLDPKKNQYIHATDPDIEKQKEYLRRYKEKNYEYYWVIEDKQGNSLGVVRIYDFQEDSFCPGSWILSSQAPFTAGIEALYRAYEFGFNVLNFSMAHFDVRKANKNVIRFDKIIGAVITHEDELNYYFELSRDKFLNTQQLWHRLLGIN